jgi:hypothetical protein
LSEVEGAASPPVDATEMDEQVRDGPFGTRDDLRREIGLTEVAQALSLDSKPSQVLICAQVAWAIHLDILTCGE